MVAVLMMSAKLADAALFKIKVFWNKDYDIIVSVHGVTQKILSLDYKLCCRCGDVIKGL